MAGKAEGNVLKLPDFASYLVLFTVVFIYELPHEAENPDQPLSDIPVDKKSSRDKMAVTFLKLNIF